MPIPKFGGAGQEKPYASAGLMGEPISEEEQRIRKLYPSRVPLGKTTASNAAEAASMRRRDAGRKIIPVGRQGDTSGRVVPSGTVHRRR